MDFVRVPDGLIWSLAVIAGYAGTVSFLATSRSWYDKNSMRQKIDAALKAMSPNIARKCKIRASKCKEALANSEAQQRNLEPTVCVGTMGPTQTVGDEEKGHGWPFSEHCSRRAQRASRKIRVRHALCTDTIRAASATDVPSLNSPLSRSRDTPESGAVPINEQKAWATLDTFFSRGDKNAITLDTTPAAKATRLGYRPPITIFRARNRRLFVQEHLPAWHDAMMGRDFEIPRVRSKPIVFYLNVDDGVTRALNHEANMTLLKQWLSAANAQRKGAS